MKYQLKENISGNILPDFITFLNVVKNGSELTFDFDCKNSKFYSVSDKYNDKLWEGDVCEVFLCVGADLNDYIEIEVAPNGTIFLMNIYNNGKSLIPKPVEKSDCFVFPEITLSSNDYHLKFTVDLSKTGYKEGNKIFFNAFRIETEGGIPEKNLLSLNPTLCDSFHKPEFFIEL